MGPKNGFKKLYVIYIYILLTHAAPPTVGSQITLQYECSCRVPEWVKNDSRQLYLLYVKSCVNPAKPNLIIIIIIIHLLCQKAAYTVHEIQIQKKLRDTLLIVTAPNNNDDYWDTTSLVILLVILL